MGNRPAARSTILFLCAAVFLVSTGARWWLIGRFGTDLPYLDQWDAEARFLYKPYFEDSLAPGAWFAAHNEHRIFFSRLLGLGLLLVNGQWDARLQMVVNAALYATVAGALFVLLSRGRSERFALLCAGGLSKKCGWNLFQKTEKVLSPLRRTLMQIPRMITEAGQHLRMLPRQFGDVRPIFLARAVHHHANKPFVHASRHQLALPSAKAVVLQMIVRVVKPWLHRMTSVSPLRGSSARVARCT